MVEVKLPPLKSYAARAIQLRSGHMLCKAYLQRIGKIPPGGDTSCGLCNAGVRQSRDHLLMRCKRYQKELDTLLWTVGVRGPRMMRQLKKRQWTAKKLLKEARSEDLWVFVERTDIGKRVDEGVWERIRRGEG